MPCWVLIRDAWTLPFNAGWVNRALGAVRVFGVDVSRAGTPCASVLVLQDAGEIQ